MVSNQPFIHLFKTRDKNYLYDVNTNTILQITEDIFNLLSNNSICNKSFSNKKAQEKIEKLKSYGFLSNKRLKAIEHPYDHLLSFYLKCRLNTITLQVTQQCNLRCGYCVYSGSYEGRTHSNKIMDIKIAKKGIDFLINHSTESPVIDVGFYGGEPLLRFDFIKECISYAKEKAKGKHISFHMTTNGTLLNDYIIDYLVQNDVRLLISLDGPQEIHDKNRRFAVNGKGTFHVILNNVKTINDRYPEYAKRKVAVNAVLDSTSNFKCINDFFTQCDDIKDFKINTSFVSNAYSKNKINFYETFLIQYRYERFKYLLYKIGKIDKKYISRLFDKDFNITKRDIYEREHYESLPERGHPSGPCLPGVRKLFLDVNGTFFPCERVNELSEVMKIGNIYEGFNIDKIRQLLNIGKTTENACLNCWAYRFCSLCAIASDDIDCLSKEKRISNCNKVRLQAESRLKEYCVLKEFECDFDEVSDYQEI
jgi:uncharacterized protein